MKLVGIDVGKNSHHFCIMDKETGEFNFAPSSFSNNKEGFDFLINSLKPYSKKINSIRYGRYRALPCRASKISS